jgi:ABC-type transporter Mla subunit MlaD
MPKQKSQTNRSKAPAETAATTTAVDGDLLLGQLTELAGSVDQIEADVDEIRSITRGLDTRVSELVYALNEQTEAIQSLARKKGAH